MNSTTPIELVTAEPRTTRKSQISGRRAKAKPRCRADKDVPHCGQEKTDRIDLGMALLCASSARGTRRSYDEIAAWCGCTHSTVRDIELNALRKLRRKLAKVLTPQEMERCLSFFVNNPIPAPAEEADRPPVRNALVESWTVDRPDSQP